MKRFCFLVVLMALSSSAYAGSTLSFVVGGHRIRIEAPRHCNSPSCVSISIPGIYQSRRWRDRDGDDDRDVAGQVKAAAPAAQQVLAPQTVTPAAATRPTDPPPPAAVVPPPAVFKPAAAATQEVAAPPQPAVQSPKPRLAQQRVEAATPAGAAAGHERVASDRG